MTANHTGTCVIGVGMPAMLHLEAFGREINDAFGYLPYLVGSAARSKVWRDVDVRLILPDDEFDALFPVHPKPDRYDGKWSLVCAALSELARVRTGLPDSDMHRDPRADDPAYDGITGYRTWEQVLADPPRFTGVLAHIRPTTED